MGVSLMVRLVSPRKSCGGRGQRARAQQGGCGKGAAGRWDRRPRLTVAQLCLGARGSGHGCSSVGVARGRQGGDTGDPGWRARLGAQTSRQAGRQERQQQGRAPAPVSCTRVPPRTHQVERLLLVVGAVDVEVLEHGALLLVLHHVHLHAQPLQRERERERERFDGLTGPLTAAQVAQQEGRLRRPVLQRPPPATRPALLPHAPSLGTRPHLNPPSLLTLGRSSMALTSRLGSSRSYPVSL